MRVFIKKGVKLEDFKQAGGFDVNYWVTESMESFHGEIQEIPDGEKVFKFRDSRIPDGWYLPIDKIKIDK